MRKVTRTEEVYSGYSRSPRKRRAWAADNPGNIAIRRELLARITEQAGPELAAEGQILDIGCGTGWLLRALAEAGASPDRLAGVDALPARVEAARGAVPGASIAVGDALHLDFADGSVALALMLTVLSSLPDRAAVRAALAEARRVLAPGGLLLVYEPRVSNPLNRETLLLRDGDLEAAGIAPSRSTSLTLVPALARRLGGAAPERYERLVRVTVLRTHRLVAYREPA